MPVPPEDQKAERVRAPGRRRVRVLLEGLDGGAADRTYLHGLAAELGLAGFVRATGPDAAWAEIEGEPAAVARFLEAVAPGPDGDALTVEDIPALGGGEFGVTVPRPSGPPGPLTADLGLCQDCRDELFDRGGRRFRYPFAGCARCGPAYTLFLGPDGGRAATTMAPFALCASCRAEQGEVSSRRFGAPSACCPDCGPRAAVLTPGGAVIAGELVRTAVRVLMEDQILAVKEPGGWQLWADAGSATAVAALRERLGDARPFAVLCADLAVAEARFTVDAARATALGSRRRPRVMLAPRPGGRLAPALAPGHRELAVGLASSALANLLCEALQRPIAVAEAQSPDPYEAGTGNEEARHRLSGVADAFFAHERAIAAPAVDSVVRVAAGREIVLRRGRGHAPEPLSLPWHLPRAVLALGTDSAGTPCLAHGRRAVLLPEPAVASAPHTAAMLGAAVDRLLMLTGVRPQMVAYEADPAAESGRPTRRLGDSASTALAHVLAAGGMGLVTVPRSHAHLGACLADNGEWGPVIGVALAPGLAGPGSVCAELLVGDLGRFTPAGRLDTAVGPLLDGLASLLGPGDPEQLADPAEPGAYAAGPCDGGPGEPLVVRASDLALAAAEDLAAGVPPWVVAARFQHGLADAVTAAVVRVRAETGIRTVALSGGLFGNGLLLARAVPRLEAAGLRVLTHRRVPPGEGGVALGQAVVAAASVR